MIELIIGGARSGKSAYALTKAQQYKPAKPYFIATAEAKDDEMQARIQQHQKQRSSDWHLIEVPFDLSTTAQGFSADDVVLVDCLTLWVTNWLCLDAPERWHQEKQAFIESIKQSPARWLLVSNEVGMGITPMGDLTRQFVDECGWLHQNLAQIAERVTVVMFGLPQTLKGGD